MIVSCVVAEGESRITLQLGLSPLPQILLDQRRHRHGDPLLAWPQWPATLARIARFAAARLAGRAIFVPVHISGAGIDRVGKDMMDRRRRPGPPAAPRKPWSKVQALQD